MPVSTVRTSHNRAVRRRGSFHDIVTTVSLIAAKALGAAQVGKGNVISLLKQVVIYVVRASIEADRFKSICPERSPFATITPSNRYRGFSSSLYV